MSKIDGLEMLNDWRFPTLELLTLEDLEKDPSILEDGVSVRLSTKGNVNMADVFLESIHNVHDINRVKQFIIDKQKKYDIIIHKTVKPDIIGTISKYNNNLNDILAIELYKDFADRSHGIVSSRAVTEMVGKIILSIDLDKFNPKALYLELMSYLCYIDLDEYTIEFVIENNKIIFTDLYSNSLNNKELIK